MSYWITCPCRTVLPEEGLVTVTVNVLVEAEADGVGVGDAAATVAAAAMNPIPASANTRNRCTEVRVDPAVVRASSTIGSITAQ